MKFLFILLFLSACAHIKVPHKELKDIRTFNMGVTCYHKIKDSNQYACKNEFYTCEGYTKNGAFNCDHIEPYDFISDQQYIFFGFSPEDWAKLDAYIEYLFND